MKQEEDKIIFGIITLTIILFSPILLRSCDIGNKPEWETYQFEPSHKNHPPPEIPYWKAGGFVLGFVISSQETKTGPCMLFIVLKAHTTPFKNP